MNATIWQCTRGESCCVYVMSLELLLSYVGELRNNNPTVYHINIGIRQSPWGITIIWLNKTLLIWRTFMLFHEQNLSTKRSWFLARIRRGRQVICFVALFRRRRNSKQLTAWRPKSFPSFDYFLRGNESNCWDNICFVLIVHPCTCDMF